MSAGFSCSHGKKKRVLIKKSFNSCSKLKKKKISKLKFKAALYFGFLACPVVLAEFLLCFVDDQIATRPASPLLLVEGQSSKQLSLCCCLNLDNTAGIVRNK